MWSPVKASRFARQARCVCAGILFSLVALPLQAQDAFLQSLAAAIDASSLTPRERLGLNLFFDGNLSEPPGTDRKSTRLNSSH